MNIKTMYVSKLWGKIAVVLLVIIIGWNIKVRVLIKHF